LTKSRSLSLNGWRIKKPFTGWVTNLEAKHNCGRSFFQRERVYLKSKIMWRI
jgi:hypothetical protein